MPDRPRPGKRPGARPPERATPIEAGPPYTRVVAALRVLVIGGTRFVGFHAVEGLVEAGCEVAVFHRGGSEPEGLSHVRHLHGDRTELLNHGASFDRFAPDVVLDTAPMIRSDAVDAVIAFRGTAGRLVAISSQDVYFAYDLLRGRASGPAQDLPLTEEAPLRDRLFPYRDQFPEDHPLHDYDKIPIEQTYLSQPDLPATVLRLAAVYGPRDPQHRPFPYLRRMVDGRRWIILDQRRASWRWSRVFVHHAAAAIVLAVTDPGAAGRVYNVADEKALSEQEWVEAIGAAWGWEGQVVRLPADHLPDHLREEGFDFRHPLMVDTSRIRDELGFVERLAAGEAMRRTVEWELRHMPVDLAPHRFDYAAEDAALPDLTLGI